MSTGTPASGSPTQNTALGAPSPPAQPDAPAGEDAGAPDVPLLWETAGEIAIRLGCKVVNVYRAVEGKAVLVKFERGIMRFRSVDMDRLLGH